VCLTARKNQRFSPPTIEEIQAYNSEKSLNVDAEQFLNFYESNGWMVGRNPMKSWGGFLQHLELQGQPEAGPAKSSIF